MTVWDVWDGMVAELEEEPIQWLGGQAGRQAGWAASSRVLTFEMSDILNQVLYLASPYLPSPKNDCGQTAKLSPAASLRSSPKYLKARYEGVELRTLLLRIMA